MLASSTGMALSISCRLAWTEVTASSVREEPVSDRLESFARGPYSTRILVRRPKSPRRFSGTVVVEALNPSLRYDAPIMWIESQDHFIARGDVYVGVTVKPVAVASLKLFDPMRYAALSFRNPLPPSETCGQAALPPAPGGLPPESSPATENGLISVEVATIVLMMNVPFAGPIAFGTLSSLPASSRGRARDDPRSSTGRRAGRDPAGAPSRSRRDR